MKKSWHGNFIHENFTFIHTNLIFSCMKRTFPCTKMIFQCMKMRSIAWHDFFAPETFMGSWLVHNFIHGIFNREYFLQNFDFFLHEDFIFMHEIFMPQFVHARIFSFRMGVLGTRAVLRDCRRPVTQLASSRLQVLGEAPVSATFSHASSGMRTLSLVL